MLGVSLAVLLGLPAPGQVHVPPVYTLEMTRVKHIEGTLSLKIDCPNINAREWNLFLAQAPELCGQKKVRMEVTPRGKLLIDTSPLQRKLVEIRIAGKDKKPDKTINLKVVYQAELYSRRLKAVPAGKVGTMVPDLDPKEQAMMLKPTGSIDHHQPSFRFWLKKNQLVRAPREGEIDFARRVFLAIRSQFKYDFRGAMDRRASSVCLTGNSDCGGLSILFTAALRANGIPARILYGRWATSADPNEKVGGFAYSQAHVLAEFFAPGVGWVPADLASSILHDKSPQGLACFGMQPGNFFAYHIDPDVSFRTQHYGNQTFHGLQNPAFWVQGTGSVQPLNVTLDWQVRTMDNSSSGSQ